MRYHPSVTQNSSRRKPDLSGFRFDTGRLSLDFLGTIGHRPAEHVERLTDATRLVHWLSQAGLPADRVRINDTDLSHALSIREALHTLIDAALNDQPRRHTALAQQTVAQLNAAAAVPTPVPILTKPAERRGRTQPEVPKVRWDQPVALAPLIAVVVRDGLELIHGPHRDQLRRCDAGDCRKIFLDTAPRPRRWCSRQNCGTRSRVAAHRQRQRDQLT